MRQSPNSNTLGSVSRALLIVPPSFVSTALNTLDSSIAVDSHQLWPRVPVPALGSGPAVGYSLSYSGFFSRVPPDRVGAAGWRNNFRVREAFGHPAQDGISLNASDFAKISGHIDRAIDHDVPCLGLVSALPGSCGPAAIIRAVVAIIVNAVKGVAYRPFPHVVSKALERFTPSLANPYPSPTVVPESGVRLAVAALLHVAPRLIERMGIFKGHGFLHWFGYDLTIMPDGGKEYA